MITKEQLLLKASIKSDSERFDMLREYDFQQNGVMLYRYRHLSKTTMYELDALSECRIWASNPEFFDDEYEFMPSCNSPKDYECIRYFMKRELKQPHNKKCKIGICEIDKLYRYNRKGLVKLFTEQLSIARRGYAISCFTENSPIDAYNNMWHQYAKDSGICLGYSLSNLIDKKIIIDPVFYVDSGKKSLGNMFELFGKNIRTALCFCIKDKMGVDKYSNNTMETICWADQNEWRYCIDNAFDESTNEYSRGRYLDREVIPDVVYVKNLNISLLIRVFISAKRHGIRVKIVG